jgi:hypothetical protein
VIDWGLFVGLVILFNLLHYLQFDYLIRLLNFKKIKLAVKNACYGGGSLYQAELEAMQFIPKWMD